MAEEALALCLPLKLDAFVFNKGVCDEAGADQAKIAPIVQPNYTFLRVTDSLALNDVLPHVDLHNAAPAERNSRYTNVGTGKPRSSRVGVYLHWMVPRPFRRGVAVSESTKAEKASLALRMGARLSMADAIEKDHSAPVFLPIPNRWLVIRKLDPNAATTKPPGTLIPPVTAWIIESDRVRYIDDIDEKADLQIDLAPFITAFLEKAKDAENIKIDKQAEVFIGQAYPAKGWNETSGAERVELTAASSSNQLFLDYQYHNGNVFSMLDTFEYKDGGQTKHLEEAHASYYVVGWQQDKEKDMMFLEPTPPPGKPLTRRDRLEAVAMELDESIPDKQSPADWLASTTSGRCVCHGTLYEVVWNSSKKPERVLADEFASKMHAATPLAVGTSPLDSILTYVAERSESCTLEDDISRLENLLRADDETVDAHRAAQQETEAFNFANFDGGFQYEFGDDNKGNELKQHSEDERKKLVLLNSERHLYDGVLRRLQQIQWKLFSIWWKYVSDPSKRNRDACEKEAGEAQEQLDVLQPLASNLREALECSIITPPSGGKTVEASGEDDCTKILVKQGTMEPFHQQNDPTLMLAGLRPGWPRDFNSKLCVRLENQLVPGPDEWGLLKDFKIPPELMPAVRKLLEEFSKLASSTDPDEKPGSRTAFPLYHTLEHTSGDFKQDDNPWRDRWSGRQPWFPLYLEWEADFFQIKWRMWEFGDFKKIPLKTDIADDPTCPPCDPNKPRPPKGPEVAKTGYYVGKDLTNGGNNYEEPRSLSGRMLILPQPAFSLKVHLERLFATIPPADLDEALCEAERKKLQRNLDRLEFLSAPMAGFTNHLLTRYEGTHVKPLVRIPGYRPIALKDAANVSSKLSLDIAKIDKESDPTPYGSLISLGGAKDLAFKPVTHGQFRFTKLNVIDKFGQVVHAIDPLQEDSPAIYPSVSDFYRPKQVSAEKEKPNVVDPGRSPSMRQVEFVQVPPCINQPGRWNADFVVHDPTAEGRWRPANRWENPIWGWMVVNYVDRGLQFFKEDGTFFREVRITEGKNGSASWLPLPKPTDAENPETAQLNFLIDKIITEQNLGNHYIEGMMAMIEQSVRNSAPALSAYGQFLNSLVGKPLALVNMGWSLELSVKSYESQSSLESQEKEARNRDWGLLRGDATNQYKFSLKLGDTVQSHDGLVGYFKAKDLTDTKHDDLILDTIYSHYHDSNYSNLAPVSKTDNDRYPEFPATWVDPFELDKEAGADERARSYDRRRYQNLRVFGAIADPFRPIHGFSGILPLRSLALPTWTWEGPMKRMTTFFHAGPVLVTAPLPPVQKDKVLERIDEIDTKILGDDARLELPALQIADWAWLQPYLPPKTPASSQEDKSDAVCMPLPIKKGDKVATLARGPYTAVDGYMILKAPIERDEPPKKPAALVDGMSYELV